MITDTDAERRRDHGRLLWSLLASVLLHVFAWTAVTRTANLSFLRNVGTAHETLAASSSPIRIERRIVRPQPRRQPQRTASAALQRASLSLPLTWIKQDYGNIAATEVPVWLDWTKQTANFVPRVMLWQMQAAQPYMRQPSLRDSVQTVVTALRAEDARVYTSKAQRVCRGGRPGWFLSYLKPGGDPPVRVEETLIAVGQTIYGAIYVRPADQPEDTKARAALNTLCQP